ncbi:uncharacterized protein LAESUDRAFT_762073 [Laetiporus sulphureus 93-53]|uniref:DUF7598 domain-containing protein n=1 Tax=Laetiporus sulphureus 93-53 TaxID=1314785 RepID=A0A165CRH3_9APHY|nr:uncharacterized protein LAESUDRAFT_762073 [Laetiporus sulphureus 93-53]KZT03297.1 hypothetical protein LAESUDRAFT_762073 [Laetiporus sulphureus 93-53]
MAPPRAYIFIGLNITRVLSIVALILIFASSIVTLVQDIKAVNKFIAEGKEEVIASSDNTTVTDDCSHLDYVPNSTVPNQTAGAFWAVLNRIFIVFQVVVLLLSEIGWPAAFFNRYFPVLGDDFGLGALGVIQCLLGAAVLSHHVDEFSLVSGFFLFSVGCLNALLGLAFREKAKPGRALTSWRDDDVLPRTSLRSGPRPFLAASSTGGSSWNEKEAEAHRTGSSSSKFSGKGFGRQGEKAAMALGATVAVPPESLPTYVPRSAHSPAPTYISRPLRRVNSDSGRHTYASTRERAESGVSYAGDGPSGSGGAREV